MKTIRYTADALKDLKRYCTIAAWARKALGEYAADPAAHANNVTRLVGSDASRMRIGEYRIVFVETATALTVIKIAPRGSVYD
jgi:mRNA interferase RelE/StbE